jgi:ureidoacrylate peracid hydrolase
MNPENIPGIEEQLRAQRCALIVIDMQNDFCHPDGFLAKAGMDVKDIRAMIPNLSRFVSTARAEGVRIFMVQSLMEDRYLSPAMRYRKLRIGRSEDICKENSWGQKQIEELSPQPGDVVINKHTYSAFQGTGLTEKLIEIGIETLIVTGVLTEVCVETTVRDSACLHFYNVIPNDCTASNNPDSHWSALLRIDKFFGTVLGSEDIVGKLHY